MVHIGKKIKQQLTIKKISVADFALKINTTRNNVYNIFVRQSIDSELLFKICIILNHDFFQYYKPFGDTVLGDENDYFNMPDRDWFSKQFKALNKKIDQLQK